MSDEWDESSSSSSSSSDSVSLDNWGNEPDPGAEWHADASEWSNAIQPKLHKLPTVSIKGIASFLNKNSTRSLAGAHSLFNKSLSDWQKRGKEEFNRDDIKTRIQYIKAREEQKLVDKIEALLTPYHRHWSFSHNDSPNLRDARLVDNNKLVDAMIEFADIATPKTAMKLEKIRFRQSDEFSNLLWKFIVRGNNAHLFTVQNTPKPLFLGGLLRVFAEDMSDQKLVSKIAEWTPEPTQDYEMEWHDLFKTFQLFEDREAYLTLYAYVLKYAPEIAKFIANADISAPYKSNMNKLKRAK